jgi:hypothetical protein
MNELPRQNTDKEVHMNIKPQPNFEITPARSFDLSPLDFYVCVCVCVHLQTLLYSAAILNEETSTHFLRVSNQVLPSCDL